MPQTRDERYHSGLRCEERIDAGVMAFPCTLAQGHDGPHYAQESTRSRVMRQQWEDEQEAKEAPPQVTDHDQMCGYGGAHEGECKPVEETKATVTPADGGGYTVTLPSGAQITIDGEGNPERPSGVIGVQDSLRELLNKEPSTTYADPLAPTKTREGDQRLPDVDHRRGDVQSLVIRDIEERRKVGIQRYGTALQTFNGRNTLQDLYEECIDSTVYARSLLEMREATREELIEAAWSVCYGEEIDTYTWDRVIEKIVDKILDAVVLKIANGQDCG